VRERVNPGIARATSSFLPRSGTPSGIKSAAASDRILRRVLCDVPELRRGDDMISSVGPSVGRAERRREEVRRAWAFDRGVRRILGNV
jgi:hypothetical protein